MPGTPLTSVHSLGVALSISSLIHRPPLTPPAITRSFSASLRSILRQDPDVLLIGEIRDEETANIAVKFSMTGHLVFSTVHANDATSTIARLLDLGIPPFLLGSSLNLVMAQRLVRTIDKNNKENYTPSKDELNLISFPKDKQKSTKFYNCLLYTSDAADE